MYTEHLNRRRQMKDEVAGDDSDFMTLDIMTLTRMCGCERMYSNSLASSGIKNLFLNCSYIYNNRTILQCSVSI